MALDQGFGERVLDELLQWPRIQPHYEAALHALLDHQSPPTEDRVVDALLPRVRDLLRLIVR
jgi:hypothetical protein